ncbi:MAG: hypothetical protein HRT72_10020, partial [Flavobacteriales bacterium]|nr:hypothetical protein [Flavobacteriales bacterium]
MKNTILSIALSVFMLSGYAQSIEVGGLGSLKSTWILNENITNTSSEQDYQPTWGYSAGAFAAVHISKKFGVELDYQYGTHNQGFSASSGPYNFIDTLNNGDSDFSKEYNSTIELTSQDIALLLLLGGEEGGHVELGVQYSSLSAALYSK